MDLSTAFDAHVIHLAFVLGVVVSVAFYDRSHLSTGSVVVPGYLGLCVGAPATLAVTLVNALAMFVVVHRILPRFVILSREAKFHGVLLGSVLVQFAWSSLLPEGAAAQSGALQSVGFLIPGLIAHDLNRQGATKTMLSIGVCSTIVGAAVVLASFASSGAPPSLSARPPEGVLSVGREFVPFVILLGTTAAISLQRNYGARCGGFVGSAYLGLIVLDPFQVLYLAGTATVTHAFVTRVLMPRMVVFGRRKFAAMLLFGCWFAWAGVLVLQGLLDAPVASRWVWTAPPFVGVVLAGLLANDMERASPRHVLLGTGMATILVLSGALLLAECTGDARPALIALLGLAFAASLAVVFGPDLGRLWRALEPAVALPARGALPAPIPSLRLPALGLAALLAVVLFVGPRHAGMPGSAEAALVEHRQSQLDARPWVESLPFARLSGPQVSGPWAEFLVPILADVANVLVPPYLLERE